MLHIRPFLPNRSALATIVHTLAQNPRVDGLVVDSALRASAFAKYEKSFSALHLPFDELQWHAQTRTLPTTPLVFLEHEADEHLDRPALAVENAGGLVHVGATVLIGPRGERDDERAVVVPLQRGHRIRPKLLARAQHALVDPHGSRDTALAAAFQNCGAFVYVPSGVVLDAPIQLVWVYGHRRTEAIFPHIVVVLGAGARATVIERHIGDGEAFVCGVVETHLAADAHLDYAALVQMGDGVRLRMTRAARCERAATMNWHLAELGSAASKNVLTTRLDGAIARTNTGGLFLNTGSQHADLVTLADHRFPRTHSTTVVRCAASDYGTGRYTGNIQIRPRAHESNAHLRVDTLALSPHAKLETRPELRIRANDIIAYHAATAGSLDEDALFYLSNRGIAHSEAVRMLTLAFFEPVISRFPSESLREEVRTALDHKIDTAVEAMS